MQKPLGFGSILLEQVFANQHLHEFIPVNFTNHASGVIIVCNIGGIFCQQIPYDLVDWVIAFLRQGIKHAPENTAHIFFVVTGYCEFLGILIRRGFYLLGRRI